MNRREFLTGLVAGAATVRYAGEEVQPQPTAALSIADAASAAEVPLDFIGLSYESAQLANQEFFSASNHTLVGLFRELAPRGNLRLGGGSSEYTTYSDSAPSSPPPFEVFGPDTSKTVKKGTITSALALHNLRAFLDATGWNCLYGLNLGQGTVENAVREAAAAHTILGPRLLALQIGNEPDSFRRRFRPATYEPGDFIVEWNHFHDAIVSAVPDARFAGPDISNKLPYLTAFAENAKTHKDVILLTSHYYAMGPAGNPAATLDNLLSPDPKLTTLKHRDLHLIEEAQKIAGLPYRMSEGNSCWDGGKPGVSDTFASALWCADYLLTCMQRGWVGANMHGGGNGFYTPIAGAPSTGFARRPEFFGIQFAHHFVGARWLSSSLAGADPRVDSFVFERNGKHELAIINKTEQPAEFGLPAGVSVSPMLGLRGPAIDAKTGVELVNLHGRRQHIVGAPAYSATAYTLHGSIPPTQLQPKENTDAA